MAAGGICVPHMAFRAPPYLGRGAPSQGQLLPVVLQRRAWLPQVRVRCRERHVDDGQLPGGSAQRLRQRQLTHDDMVTFRHKEFRRDGFEA